MSADESPREWAERVVATADPERLAQMARDVAALERASDKARAS